MKKFVHGRYVALALILCLMGMASYSQSPVNLSLAIAPPYSPRLSDYGNQPGKVIILLQNNFQTPMSVYLRVTITGDNGVSAMTSPNYQPSQPIVLNPFQTLQADMRVLGELFDENRLVFQGTSLRDVIRTTGLPEGNYTICVQAFDYNTNQPLSAGAPMGCRTFRIASLEPPMLIRPFEDENLKAILPQNLIFSWTVPPGMEPGALYQLRIVEMLDPKRNPNDAFLSSPSPAFFETTVQGNIFVFGPAQPPLVPGRRYAWAVTVLDKYKSPNQVPTGIAIRNNGRSEVRSFYFGNIQVNANPLPSEIKKPIVRSGVKFTPDKTLRDLNKNIFKGKLIWAFSKSETGELKESSAPAETGGTEVVSQPDYAVLESKSSGGDASSGGKKVYVFGGGNTSGIVNTVFPLKDIKTSSPEERKRNAINELADATHYPLANTKIEIWGLVKKTTTGAPGEIKLPQTVSLSKLIGTTTTNGTGDFEVVYHGDDFLFIESVTLFIKSPYFEFAAMDIPVVKGENGTYDLGELLGLAKTIRLKIKVTDQDGKPLSTAKIQVMRPSNFYAHPLYANLTHEVMHDETKSRPVAGETFTAGPAGLTYDIGYAAELVGEATGTGLFRKVFINDNLHDKYIIRISGDNAATKTYQFLADGYTGDITSGQVMTIEKVYKLVLNNPVVKGRVLVKQGELPVENATVAVLPKKYEDYDLLSIAIARLVGGGKGIFTGTTNKNGEFSIPEIAASNESYILKVFYQTTGFKDPKPLFLTSAGLIETRDPVYINAELVTVCGTVTDMKGVPLANATLHWKAGGESFTTNNTGEFLTKQTEGKHILVAQLPGYKDSEQEITVTKSKSGSTNSKVSEISTSAAGKWATSVPKSMGSKELQLGSFINAGAMSSFTNGVSIQQAVMGNLYNQGDIINESNSCGHVIQMKKFYVSVAVTNEVKAPLRDAQVEVEYNEATRKTTNSDGIAIVSDVPSPSAVLIIKGPEGSLYIPVKKSVAIDNSKDTIELSAILKTGSQIKGKVVQNGTAIKDAEVVVVGMEHINARTDASGNYSLPGVPVGEYNFRASREGMLGDDTTLVTQADKSYTLDFNLKDPGFNASRLLGFKLVLHKSEALGTNEFKISGELVEIPDNLLFKKKEHSNLRIPFTNAVVVKSGSSIVPKEGSIKTDVSEIPLTVFNWMQVKLRNGSGITLKQMGTEPDKGELVGELALDVTGTFSSLTNWKLPSGSIKLAIGTETSFGALTSTGGFTGSSFKLNGSSDGWEIYSVKFTPDLANSEISTAGLSLKGKIEVKDLPAIGSFAMNIKNLLITKSGTVGNVDLELTPKPQIKLSAWNLTVEAAAIDAYGFKFTGNMKVPIPNSPEANIGFSDLGISAKTGITGGKFYLPDVGLNIFEIVKFKAGAEAIALQKLPASSVYQFVGSGSMSLPKFIKQELKVDNFSIRSDWNFSAKVQTDFTVGFADMASLTITKVGISTAPAGFDIGGKFKLNIPNFGLGAGGEIHYRKGGAVSVDDLAIAFNLSSAVGMSANVKFGEDQFSGGGFLKIPGLSSGVGLQFLYKNLPGGKLVKADFTTGVVIPIGIVKLDQLGGGFSCNTATSIYSVTAKGRITFAADPAGLLALNPVSVTITSTPKGPIFEGGANVVLMNSWKIGEASMKIDFPDKYFFIDGKFGGGFTLMKGFNVDANAGIHIEASAQSGNSYWMMAGYTNVNIPYVCNTGVLIAGGWNVAKTVHESLKGIPDYALYNGRMYGGYFAAFTNIGADPPPLGIKGIATLDAWYRNEGNAEIYGNVKAAAYGIKFNALWSAGASVDFMDVGIASASINVKGGLEGYYSPAGWSINGNLGADVHAHIGCDGGCNGITWGCCFNACVLGCQVCPCPCGAKICVGGNINIGYSSGAGFTFGLNIF